MRTQLHIDQDCYLHEADKLALTALKKIPLFDKLCSKVISTINEPIYYVLDMSQKVQITDKQLPFVYHMVESISKKLGISMPALYLELNREPNAYTYGDKEISISITSGLLECLEKDELYAVLAHECGHIACRHVLYTTIGRFIINTSEKGLSFLDNGLIGSLVSIPLELAFSYWQRCSELSADRAAVVCCEDALPLIKSMMRLSGGTVHFNEIDKDLFITQAEAYHEFISKHKSNKALEYMLTYWRTHPLHSVRAYEAQQWFESEEYQSIFGK